MFVNLVIFYFVRKVESSTSYISPRPNLPPDGEETSSPREAYSKECLLEGN